MKTLTSTPQQDGFQMPAEWAPHAQTWMVWPERTDNWRLGAKPAQAAFTAVARTIAQHEPLTMCVSAKQYANATAQLQSQPTKYPIRIVEISTNDAWCRDIGPTFVTNGKGDVRGVDWVFNAWGGLAAEHGGGANHSRKTGLYFPWDLDDQAAQKILAIERLARYRADDFVIEGGGIHVDGEGTLLATEATLLNANRNPHMSRAQIEQRLADYTGCSKVIWIAQGIVNDETDDHIDNMACFVKSGHIALAWTDDTSDEQHARSKAAYDVLSNSTDAKGRKLTVHKLPLPKVQYGSADEYATVDASAASGMARAPMTRLAASYANFYICNGGVILPAFDDPNDQRAANILQDLMPDRKVTLIPSREILLGGGNVHCITQQQPA
jgi:agmatine deiminase